MKRQLYRLDTQVTSLSFTQYTTCTEGNGTVNEHQNKTMQQTNFNI